MASESTFTAFCPQYHHAVELIGRRWSGAVLRAVLSGVVRFTDLAAAIPGLSDRMLSERLKELEDEGIVVREVTPETPVRIEYLPTQKGRDLAVVVQAISDWADAWGGSAERAPLDAVSVPAPTMGDPPHV